MKIKRLSLWLSLALSVLLGATLTRAAFAVEPCGGFYCEGKDDFETDLDGWGPGAGNNGYLPTLTWEANTSFGFFFPSSASGVMKVQGSQAFADKSFYLPAGTYRILTRMTRGPVSANLEIRLRQSDDLGTGTAVGVFNMRVSEFVEYQSNTFVIDEDKTVSFSIRYEPLGGVGDVYVDYFWVVKADDQGPVGPGTPTPTPRPPTVTPIPSATPYCINVTPTPPPQQFGLTPTPTPANSDWSVFNGAYLGGFWKFNINGVTTTDTANRPGSPHKEGFRIDVSSNANPTAQREGLVFDPGVFQTEPFYVTAYAKVGEQVRQGRQAYLELWAFDGNQWYFVDEERVDHLNWRPIYMTVPDNLSVSNLRAIGFFWRSEGGGGSKLFLDDVYVFGSTGMAPRCDGTYPSGTQNQSNPPNGSNPGWQLPIPANKPCPPSIKVPNNFWGPLIANLTVFLDSIYATSPEYELGRLPQAARLIAVPIGLSVALAVVFVNLETAWFVVKIRIGLAGFLLVRSFWLFIVRTIKG